MVFFEDFSVSQITEIPMGSNFWLRICAIHPEFSRGYYRPK